MTEKSNRRPAGTATPVTDAMVRAAMDEAGWWAEPYEPETIGGYPVEHGLSKEDADEINASLSQSMREILEAALSLPPAAGRDPRPAYLSAVPADVQEVVDDLRRDITAHEITGNGSMRRVENMRKAASALTSLSAANARLEAQLNGARTSADLWKDSAEKAEADLARVTKERDEANHRSRIADISAGSYVAQQSKKIEASLVTSQARIKVLEEDNARLREALEPFAEVATGIDGAYQTRGLSVPADDDEANVTMREIRRARTALGATP